MPRAVSSVPDYAVRRAHSAGLSRAVSAETRETSIFQHLEMSSKFEIPQIGQFGPLRSRFCPSRGISAVLYINKTIEMLSDGHSGSDLRLGTTFRAAALPKGLSRKGSPVPNQEPGFARGLPGARNVYITASREAVKNRDPSNRTESAFMEPILSTYQDLSEIIYKLIHRDAGRWPFRDGGTFRVGRPFRAGSAFGDAVLGSGVPQGMIEQRIRL